MHRPRPRPRSDPATTSAGSDASDTAGDPPPDAGPLDASVRGSVEQVAVLGTEPGTALTLVARDGDAVAEGTSDDQGSFLFRQVEPGGVIPYVDEAAPPPTRSPSWTAPPSRTNRCTTIRSWSPGSATSPTRDGTKLSASIYLPGPPEDGPYPTVVEYSGYNPADPTAPSRAWSVTPTPSTSTPCATTADCCSPRFPPVRTVSRPSQVRCWRPCWATPSWP